MKKKKKSEEYVGEKQEELLSGIVQEAACGCHWISNWAGNVSRALVHETAL